MLSENALIVQTIFLEADTSSIVSLTHLNALIRMEESLVKSALRHATPFMSIKQRQCVLNKITIVCNDLSVETPAWLAILESKN